MNSLPVVTALLHALEPAFHKNGPWSVMEPARLEEAKCRVPFCDEQ